MISEASFEEHYKIEIAKYKKIMGSFHTKKGFFIAIIAKPIFLKYYSLRTSH